MKALIVIGLVALFAIGTGVANQATPSPTRDPRTYGGRLGIPLAADFGPEWSGYYISRNYTSDGLPFYSVIFSRDSPYARVRVIVLPYNDDDGSGLFTDGFLRMPDYRLWTTYDPDPRVSTPVTTTPVGPPACSQLLSSEGVEFLTHYPITNVRCNDASHHRLIDVSASGYGQSGPIMQPLAEAFLSVILATIPSDT